MKPTFAHARDKREVVLDDGRVGRLQHVTRESRIATVVIGGRRYRIPCEEVLVFSTHGIPTDGILPCCGRSVADISPEDRISEIAEALSCPGGGR
jgi:hypothetical protein